MAGHHQLPSFMGHLANGNNGNVYQLTNNKDNTRSQIFTYDQLNRLTSGKTSASNAWGTNYTIDAWGNLTQKTVMPGMLSGENFVQASLNNNRITGFSYDAAGNTTSDGINSYTYNAENQIVSAAGVTYAYDGNGDRVRKSSGRLYWYGAAGIVAESDLSGNLIAEYLFFDGERVARRDLPSGAVHYYFSDRLKSTSVVSNSLGAIEEESDYRPWGEEKVITHSLTDQHYKFNGKERDTETGFDEFGARLYSSAWSRWLTPDWAADAIPVPYAQMDDPQTLNLYAYAVNNPTTLPDLDGHLTPIGGGGSSANQPDDIQDLIDEARAEIEEMRSAAKQSMQKFLEMRRKAPRALDWFNENVGFKGTHCSQGKDCLNAIGMAATGIYVAIVTGGESKAGFVEEQIATSGAKVERLIANVVPEDLEAAQREINGGMKVAKAAGQGLYDHAGELGEYRNGLERQIEHLQRQLRRTGLTESQIKRMNEIINRAKGMSETILKAITPRETM